MLDGFHMQTQHQHKKPNWLGVGFTFVGTIVLRVSSLTLLPYLAFLFPHKSFLGVRLLIGFAIAFLCFYLASRQDGFPLLDKNFVKRVVAIIGGFGALGIMSAIAYFWEHRQPHFLSSYDYGWLAISVALLVYCILWSRKHPKIKHRNIPKLRHDDDAA
jgi:hypothetical protein